jgi:hypothetical protein
MPSELPTNDDVVQAVEEYERACLLAQLCEARETNDFELCS